MCVLEPCWSLRPGAGLSASAAASASARISPNGYEQQRQQEIREINSDDLGVFFFPLTASSDEFYCTHFPHEGSLSIFWLRVQFSYQLQWGRLLQVQIYSGFR